jgi:peptide/nickel transport system ATP-binding protein
VVRFLMLLSVERLELTLATARGPARALREVSFELERGGSLGLVGESGSGKSLTALALLGLLPEGARLAGRVVFDGRDLTGLDDSSLRRIRGRRIGMVFQEPMSSLNPLHPIGRQVAEPLRLHLGLSRAAAEAEAVRLLDRVGLPEPRRRLAAYPHQLSGGQRQRVMIAIALSCGPDLLIADEPTTALDVTVQQQILELILGLVEERGMALLLISHDLDVIGGTVDKVLVMYGGAVAERAPTEALFRLRAHPYSQGLFAAMPRLGRGRSRLGAIPGTVPELRDLPRGCPFAGRCFLTAEACYETPPPLLAVAPGHHAACIRLDEALKTAEASA